VAGTVAETIRELTRRHIAENDGLVVGQCLTAVGWVQNTIPPQAEGMVELPMTDVAGAGIAVGAAIMGRRPIFVIRFQSFLWLNASPIVNYAAKSKEMFGYPAPVFVRAIATEEPGAGPLHTNCFHAPFMHMPGMTVTAPMTPGEYEAIWDHYLTHDDVMLVSEHRRSYRSADELPDRIHPDARITLYGISAGRLNAIEAADMLEAAGIPCNVVHLVWLKPTEMTPRVLDPLRASGRGIVIDSAYEIAGASRSVAYELMDATGLPVKALGQHDRSPGVIARLANGTPTPERIVATAKAMLGMG
jgi:pyruvate dehydrogenase E1 component beta subunit